MVTAMVTPWRCIQTGTKYPIAESNAEGGHSVPTQQNDRSPRRGAFLLLVYGWCFGLDSQNRLTSALTSDGKEKSALPF